MHITIDVFWILIIVAICVLYFIISALPIKFLRKIAALIPNAECGETTEEWKVPKHIGFIMDGNRRYGKRMMGNRLMGHHKGARTFIKMCNWAKKRGVSEVTCYAWSMENWKRSDEERVKLFDIAYEMCDELKQKGDMNARFNIIFTNRNGFPKKILRAADELNESARRNTGVRVNILFGYGGHDEIALAAQAVARLVKRGEIKVGDINANLLQSHLKLSSPLDCIVRTSGEKRLSGFLPWQSTYAELIFLKKLWPEMEFSDFDDILEEFSQRKRRFGQ